MLREYSTQRSSPIGLLVRVASSGLWRIAGLLSSLLLGQPDGSLILVPPPVRRRAHTCWKSWHYIWRLADTCGYFHLRVGQAAPVRQHGC